jgi:uncharacterized protein
MITVVKLNPQGIEKLQYSAEIAAHLEGGVMLNAYWTGPTRDLGYTTFEPGDHFVEYFYTDRWFNIFAISTAQGQLKGWYCNVAAPALISKERIEQIDLYLDVWVSPDGQTLLLDEDEFASDETLTETQRNGARQGLDQLFLLIEARQIPFQAIETGVQTPDNQSQI